MSDYVYGPGDFEKLANFFEMVGDREVLIPLAWGTGTISAVKAKKGQPAMIKVTNTYTIPDGALKAGVNDVMPVMGMTPFFVLLYKPGTLVFPTEEELEPLMLKSLNCR